MRSFAGALVVIVAPALVVAASCSYPSFRYDKDEGDDDGDGGGQAGSGASGSQGGFGGAGQSSTTSTTSSMTSTSTGVMVMHVWCKETAPQECPQGQICCYHNSDPALDKCGAPGMCGANFIQLACDSPDDCPTSVCCGTSDGVSATGTACMPACGAPGAEICDTGADCADGTCEAWPNDTFPYPNYGWCL